MDEPPRPHGNTTGAETVTFDSEPLPATIGDDRILNVLGRGGMGIVYEAQQDSPRRSVALKVIRRGLLSTGQLRRFQHEAEVLAWLAGILVSKGEHEAAAELYRDYIARASQLQGPGATLVQRARFLLVNALVTTERLDEAAAVLEDIEDALDETHDSEQVAARLERAWAALAE